MHLLLLRNPDWWITSVLLALLMNLLSAYLKPALDKLGGNFSKRIKTANQVKAEKRQNKIDEVVGNIHANPLEYIALKIDLIQYGGVFCGILLAEVVVANHYSSQTGMSDASLNTAIRAASPVGDGIVLAMEFIVSCIVAWIQFSVIMKWMDSVTYMNAYKASLGTGDPDDPEIIP